MPSQTGVNNPLTAGMEFCGEYLVPGGSNLVKGDILQAALHAGLGLGAWAFLGLPGLLLVSSDSISKALTERHLYQSPAGVRPRRRADAAPASDAPTVASAGNEAAPTEAPPAPGPAQPVPTTSAGRRPGARRRAKSA